MMQKIANIVSDSKKNGFEVIFNKVASPENLIPGLPTLYIGLETARNNIKGFNILNKTYPEQNCRWTFSRTERRNEYNDDLEKFKKDSIMKALANVKYDYADVAGYSLTKIKNFINYINSDDHKLCFLTKNSKFLFIYSRKYNRVWGLSLTTCEYLGIDRKKILSRVKSNRHNRFIYDTSFLKDDMRGIVGNNTHYILPLYDYFME